MLNIIKDIKYSRLKPEEIFILDILVNLKKYLNKKYPTFIFYKKDDILLFKYDRNTN